MSEEILAIDKKQRDLERKYDNIKKEITALNNLIKNHELRIRNNENKIKYSDI
jgi:hypothetical protein